MPDQFPLAHGLPLEWLQPFLVPVRHVLCLWRWVGFQEGAQEHVQSAPCWALLLGWGWLGLESPVAMPASQPLPPQAGEGCLAWHCLGQVSAGRRAAAYRASWSNPR